MGCSNRDNRNRAVIDGMFDKGHVKGAAWQRQDKCAHASGCGYFCEWLDKTAQGIASCECPDGRIEDLHAAFKRRESRCAEGRW